MQPDTALALYWFHACCPHVSAQDYSETYLVHVFSGYFGKSFTQFFNSIFSFATSSYAGQCTAWHSYHYLSTSMSWNKPLVPAWHSLTICIFPFNCQLLKPNTFPPTLHLRNIIFKPAHLFYNALCTISLPRVQLCTKVSALPYLFWVFPSNSYIWIKYNLQCNRRWSPMKDNLNERRPQMNDDQ